MSRINDLHHQSIIVSHNGEKFFLKVGGRNELRREFDALFLCSELIPECVPGVHNYYQKENIDLLILSYKKHKKIKNLRDLNKFFVMMSRGFNVSCLGVDALNGGIHPDVEDYIRQKSPRVFDYIDKNRNLICEMPRYLQHCDLALCNVGSGPMVYDWEDFALCDLAGFDVCILLGSIVEHDPAKFFEMVECYSDLIAVLDINIEDFKKMAPVYYAIFAWIKKKNFYSEKVEEKSIYSAEFLSKYF